MGLEVTRPYGNFCGIDSKSVQAYGLIKNLKSDLFAFPDLNTMTDVVVIDLPPVYGMLLSRKWVVGLGGYLMMDLSYTCKPNSNENLIIICMEPFIDGYLETYEDGMKNTYGKGTLGVERINMASKDDDYTPVFSMGVGSSDSQDESDVRFRQELIH